MNETLPLTPPFTPRSSYTDPQATTASTSTEAAMALVDSTNTVHGRHTKESMQDPNGKRKANQGVIYNQGYPSPAASQIGSSPSSPVIHQSGMFVSGSVPNTRPAQSAALAPSGSMQGIESTFMANPSTRSSASSNVYSLPAIPPFNPNAKRRRQDENVNENQGQPASRATSQQGSSVPPMAPSGMPSRQANASGSGSARGNGRPVTANVMQSLPPTTPNSYLDPSQANAPQRGAATTGARPSRNDRASYQTQIAPNTVASSNPGMGIHQQPYAMSQSQAHSSRPRIFFGPYQLLQTLGEGEFGKVKLGVRGDHRWSEEFAVKLMKRGSVQESQQRMIKVVREIEVLRVVKHPNIVRLYDVIETEKYIGIVLEYASGGELFDHILAHRYLKERDATKLFAQLISGVAYMHAKKIVHRDLKLENLLLDRNRNIMITDFGFANRFEEKGDDLMATSCGSPCYAAPELVVQDGKYVGSAVDVWSCGVILYAMLAGYLPFDDDPANPDSENINLLYKYILNTPLSFPEWIGPGPRDLLHRMLVPDPLKRCTLDDVARHPWLHKYVDLFAKTVDELEEMAVEKDELQKLALMRQRDAIVLAEQQQMQQQNAANMTRSQSSASAANRHQSAIVMSSSAGAPVTARPLPISHHSQQPTTQTSRQHRAEHTQSAIIVPTSVTASTETTPVLATADTFSYDRPTTPQSAAMSVSASAPGRAVTPEETLESAVQKKRSKPSADVMSAAEVQAEEAARRRRAQQAHRYTVQVEYTAQPAEQVSKAEAIPQPSPRTSSRRKVTPPSVNELPPAGAEDAEKISKESTMADAVLPSAIPLVDRTNALDRQGAVTPIAATQPSVNVPFPSPERETRVASAQEENAEKTHVTRSASTASVARPPSASSSRSRHNKQGSSDRFSISRFLSSSSTADRQNSGNKQSTSSEQVIGNADGTEERKKGRRKALSLVVEPFKSSTRAKRTSVRVNPPSASTSSNDVTSPAATITPGNAEAAKMSESTSLPRDRPRTRSTIITPGPPGPSPPVVTPPQTSPRKATAARRPGTATSKQAFGAVDDGTNWVANGGPPANKAKRVMDWFRWRSLPRDDSFNSLANTKRVPQSDLPEAESTVAEPAVTEAAPQLVVTGVTNEAETPTAQLEAVQTTADDVAVLPPIAASVSMPSAVAQQVQNNVDLRRDHSISQSIREEPTATKDVIFNESRLRFHSGAVDQNALTSRSPPVVLEDIRQVLWSMGIEVREEVGPYRLKCTRQSSKRVALAYGTSVANVHQGNVQQSIAASVPHQRVVMPNLASSTSGGPLTNSPSATFRSLFARRGSASPSVGPLPSPAISTRSLSSDSPDLLFSPLTPSTSNLGNSVPSQPVPFYGSNDSGSEVRFTVELSRMKNLQNLYAIDVRRLKGNLWSYRDIYNELFANLHLQQ